MSKRGKKGSKKNQKGGDMLAAFKGLLPAAAAPVSLIAANQLVSDKTVMDVQESMTKSRSRKAKKPMKGGRRKRRTTMKSKKSKVNKGKKKSMKQRRRRRRSSKKSSRRR